MSEKKALRKALLGKRAAIPGHERIALDEALCRRIAAHPDFSAADALLMYLPMRGEPDLTPLLHMALARNIPVYLPRCEENGMRFLAYQGKDQLPPDRFGIPAPPKDAPEAHTTDKTLCIIPGLSADRQGTRLGYGGGFYDRFLPRFEGKTLFALYSTLIVDALPHEELDVTIPPDRIITEKGVLSNAKMDTRTPKL